MRGFVVPRGYRALRRSFDPTLPTTPGRSAVGSRIVDGGNNVIMALRKGGCKNRPVFTLIVTKSTAPRDFQIDPIEQLGVFDPLINSHGEKMCSLNLERIVHYLAQGASMQTEVAQLLGLAGLLPQHPETYRTAWRNRRELLRVAPVPDHQDVSQEAEEG